MVYRNGLQQWMNLRFELWPVIKPRINRQFQLWPVITVFNHGQAHSGKRMQAHDAIRTAHNGGGADGPRAGQRISRSHLPTPVIKRRAGRPSPYLYAAATPTNPGLYSDTSSSVQTRRTRFRHVELGSDTSGSVQTRRARFRPNEQHQLSA